MDLMPDKKNPVEEEKPKKKRPASRFKDNIVVMPDIFYGVTPKLKSVVEKTKPIVKKVEHPKPEVKKIAKKPPKVFPKKKRNIITPVIIGVGGFLIISLLGFWMYATYFIKQTPVVEKEPETPIVVVVPEPEIAPEPYCGDDICNAEETCSTCADDCGECDEEVEVEPEITPTILSLMHAYDSDGDGLTDSEEILFGLDENNKDSDEDSFQDGTELINLYNPLGKEPSRLEFSGLVKTYVNPTFDYDVFYPMKWFARSVDKVNREVVLTSPMSEFISIKVLDNPTKQTAKVWYLNQHTDITSSEVLEFINSHNIQGVISPDEFRVYFAKDRNVYEIHYDIGLKSKANYPNIFKMIYESFIFTANGGSL